MDNNIGSLPEGALSPLQLRLFFIDHLNRIYCVKSHLQERLPEIKEHAHFSDLSDVILDTLAEVERQVLRMDQVFLLLGAEHEFENCKGVLRLIEDLFSAIYRDSDDVAMRDLSILFYLQNIESIELVSFKMLIAASPALDNKEIKELLEENLNASSKGMALLQQLTDKYLKGGSA